MGGAPTPALLRLWNEWEIQVVVLLSFTLQLFLFFFAGIRRYRVSFVVRAVLWLVYLFADVAATFALGHMSSSTELSRVHQLVPIWAPFLVLHLGGQDTITAYALEDNKLWLRHLLNLFVQVAGTSYVLYKYIISGGSFVAAAILVLTAGVFKYGERIWALKLASMKGSGLSWVRLMDIRTCIIGDGAHAIIWDGRSITADDHYPMYQHVTEGAHSMLFQLKYFLAKDAWPVYDGKTFKNLCEVLKYDREALEQTRPSRAELVYKMIEVELSLVYDLLYTKVAVIHKWYGHCIRAISLATSLAALCIFQTSKKDGYATPDIVITYILFVGAFSLEVTSALRTIGSIVTCGFITRYFFVRVGRAILHVRYRLLLAFAFIVSMDGRWSESLGQYNLISSCKRDETKTGTIFQLVGLGDWWIRFQYTSHVKLSSAVKELVLKKVEEKASGMIQDGEPYTECRITVGMDPWALRCMGFDESNLLDWTFQCDFEESILVWHIATTSFLKCTTDTAADGDKALRESISVLSDYLVYLLTVHPDILGINIDGTSMYESTNIGLTNLWDHFSAENEVGTTPHGGMILDCMKHMNESSTSVHWTEGVLVKSCRLVRIMLHMKLDLTRRLQVFAGVWVEMLCYAARNAPAEFHAGQLSKGGEFATHVLLLMTHIGIVTSGYRANYELSLTAEEISEGEDHRRSKQVELNVEMPTKRSELA